MPGTVIAVRVEEGAEVDAGQVLVVLEAMKMENTVAAPVPGRVERVLVTAGQQVQRSETLVELL
jgi:biotin carboxyl carrier protein